MSKKSVIVDEKFCFEEETNLTVHKTSIFFPGGDGFAVYNSAGEVIFRVDYYGQDSGSEDGLVLMDSAGKPLLTLHRKKPSLHQRWEAFLGEKKEEDSQEPIFTIFKSSMIGAYDLVAITFGYPGDQEYHSEGSFSNGSSAMISIYNTNSTVGSRELVAEIKRKVDPNKNVVLRKDVFSLFIKPLVDGAFVMALVLVLDKLGGFDIDDSIANANQIMALGVEALSS